MERRLAEAVWAGQHPAAIAQSMGLSRVSIEWRIKTLGLSLRDGWRSPPEIAVLFGVSIRQVGNWCRSGQLHSTLHGKTWRRITDADLRTFVQQYAGVLFEADGVEDSELRRLAEVNAFANRRRLGAVS
jgi:hypothetical protein